MKPVTDAEMTEIARNRAQAKASFACEGIFFTEEEDALFEQFDRECLPHEERRRRILEFCRRKQAEKVAAAE